MKLQQYLINNYLHIPFEDFSHRAVAALGILTSIQNNQISEMTEERRKAIGESINKIKNIIEVTDPKLQVSLFVLDRNIAPQDFSKQAVNHNLSFTRKRPIGDQKYAKLTMDEVQNYLCYALMEINEILMKECGKVSDQFIFEES